MSQLVPPKKALFLGSTVAVAALVGYVAFASYVSSGNSDAAVPEEKISQSSYRLPKPDDYVAYTFPKIEPKQEQLPYEKQQPQKQEYRQPSQQTYAGSYQKPQPKKLNINFGQDDNASTQSGNYSRVQIPNGISGIGQGYSQQDQSLPATRQNLVNESRDFLANARQFGGAGVVRNQLQPAASNLLLQTGLIIQMQAKNAASTRQPGGLAAEVTHDVYDSLTQSCVLIPAGTVVFGPVNNQVAYAGDTMQAPFTRLHFPNGSIMDIEGMPATGVDGKPGINGKVNRHVGGMALAILGDAFFTTLGQAGQLVNQGDQTIVNVGVGAAGQSASSVGSEIVRRQLDLQNEIYINQGDSVAFMVTNDIPLPAYEDNCR